MIAYRQAAYGSPLWTVPSRKEGRYNDGTEDSPTQYLCLHPLGPLAELMRRSNYRTPAQVKSVKTRTWALRLEGDELVEINFENAYSFGILAAELVDDDTTPCQSLASRLRTDRVPGVVVPSAALPGTRNVVLFGAHVGMSYELEPLSPIDIPASITAQDGRPIVSLLDVVRLEGEEQPALAAWLQGLEFEFAEPDWNPAREDS